MEIHMPLAVPPDDEPVLETSRLRLRRLTDADFGALCLILQDRETMYAYEHAFDDGEVREWLERQQARYRDDGFGLWAAALKESAEVIGQCGLTMQDIGGRLVPEVGYLFRREFWHCGYAIEAASACRDYAFDTLGISEVYSIIRDNNFASRRVAERNGMKVRGLSVKRYYGMDMPHLIYSVRREERPDAL